MSGNCASCGTPWTDHLGIQPTCAELRQMKRTNMDLIDRLSSALDRIGDLEATLHNQRHTISFTESLLSENENLKNLVAAHGLKTFGN